MAFNIADFRSIIETGGVLQTNKYDVAIYFNGPMGQFIINDPVGNSGTTAGGQTEDLSYRCISASLPGMAMRTADINRFGIGVSEKMPYSANYTDITLTFLMDRTGATYNFWYTWFNFIFGINGEETNSNVFGGISSGNPRGSFYTAEYKDNYSATIIITVYDNEGNPQITTTLLKAFPVSINDVALNWSDNNNLIKLTTTITFREWVLGDDQNQSSLSVVRTAGE